MCIMIACVRLNVDLLGRGDMHGSLHYTGGQIEILSFVTYEGRGLKMTEISAMELVLHNLLDCPLLKIWIFVTVKAITRRVEGILRLD